MPILHFWEHHKDALQSNIFEFTEQYGSKGWILEFLRTFPDLLEHILPWFSVNYETLASWNIPNLPNNFQGIEESLIYRSSHPDDHRGYIGMLPTILSRHYSKKTALSAYDISSHELNMARVYNALNYYQSYKQELRDPGYVPFQNRDHYNLYWYPLSDPGQSYETRESIPLEYADFIDIDQYWYHIDYRSLYLSLLEKVKSGNDTTDYSEKAQWITHYRWWDYREMIKKIQESIRTSIWYKENTWLRGTEITGIYIQPEVLPNGWVMWGIYESPHKRWVYIVTFRTPTMESEKQRNNPDWVCVFSDVPTSVIYDSETWEIKEIEWDSYGKYWFIPKIIELYRKVKGKNIFWEDYSFHMEFWFQWTKPLIYQIRQFSPYQEAGFKVDPIHSNYLVRWITDAIGESVTITLFWTYSNEGKIKESTNIGIKYRRQELERNIPLRQRNLVTGTWWGRLDDDHGVTKLLYETWGIAVAGTIPCIFPNRDYDKTQTYTWILFSDGINITMEWVEEIDK